MFDECHSCGEVSILIPATTLEEVSRAAQHQGREQERRALGADNAVAASNRKGHGLSLQPQHWVLHKANS